MESLADKTQKAAAEARNLDEAFKNTKIHLPDGTTLDWDENIIEEAVKDTSELNQEQAGLSDVAERAAEAMRHMAEETIHVNEAAKGVGEAPADGVEKQLTPVQNMLSFIKQSFQDIPILFAGIANKSTKNIQQMEAEWDNLSDKAAHYKGVLQELESRGLGFGNQEYDDAYIQWQTAEQAIKDYKKQLERQNRSRRSFLPGCVKSGMKGKRHLKNLTVAAESLKNCWEQWLPE